MPQLLESTKTAAPALPPAYSRLEDGTALAYEWVGGRDNGITQHIYDIQIQARRSRPILLGQIELNPRTNCWLVNCVGHTPIHQAESLCYHSYSEAVAYLQDEYQQRKRAAVRSQLTAA